MKTSINIFSLNLFCNETFFFPDVGYENIAKVMTSDLRLMLNLEWQLYGIGYKNIPADGNKISK